MRELKFRARFEKISSGEKIWQFVSLHRGVIINPLEHLSGYLQVSDWEQYTGLKDRHDKAIYEGDILKSPIVGRSVPVKWWGVSAGFNLAWIRDHDIEIIGNIYENPELLGEEK